MALVGMLRSAGITPSLFALGPSALLVARQVMQHLPSGQGASVPPTGPAISSSSSSSSAHPNSSRPLPPPPPPSEASVLIVDRSLDLVAPSLTTDHPLDALFAADAAASKMARAPSRPPSPAVSPERTLEAKLPPPPPPAMPRPPLPLSLIQAVSSSEPACAALLDTVLTRRGKEVNTQLLKALASIADELDDDDDVSLPTRPTGEALRSLLEKLQSAPRIGVERLPDLEAIGALLEASDAAAASNTLREVVSHQKVLQHTASESTAAAFTELITLAARAHTPRRAPSDDPSTPSTPSDVSAAAPLGMQALVPLLGMFYSLAGSGVVGSAALEEHEQRLREGLLQACLRDPACGGLLSPNAPLVSIDELSGEQIMQRRNRLAAALSTIFDRLRAFAAARRGLGSSQALLLSSAQTTGEVYRPLLRYVLERAFRHEEIPEMIRLSASIGSLFSRGANLLGVKARARLTDHRTIILFVVGGISLGELRELRQLIAQHPKHRLLLGATQIASPDFVWELLTASVHVR